MIVENNKVVTIHYVLKDEEGKTLQSNEEYTQEEYLHGAENIIPGLERALDGMKAEQVIEVVVYEEEAYGPREKSLIIEVANEEFENPDSINEGEYIQLFDGTDAVVIQKNENQIIVDANHPLAGKTLFFTAKIIEIRDATEEELLQGSPIKKTNMGCGPEGCC
jgi:FKBP-type peptidyl-prolyl cis-trans isomerase SlyD